jgi:hypothetical protein
MEGNTYHTYEAVTGDNALQGIDWRQFLVPCKNPASNAVGYEAFEKDHTGER